MTEDFHPKRIASSRGVVELTDEKVTYIADSNSADRFLPRIAVARSTTENGKTTIEKSFRTFEAVDMNRVLDFNEVPDPPEDTTMRVCEDGGTDGLKFPVRNVCVRGGYLFYFDVEDVDDHVRGAYVSYHAPPIGVVPLDKVDVATPPGGRRVFRDHAHTDAKYGYEFVLIHAPDGGSETTRPAAFFVAESLAQREKWLKALRSRAEATADTKLRPDVVARREKELMQDIKPRRPKRTQKRKTNDEDEDAEDIESQYVEEAKREFGISDFRDDIWLNNFFMNNNDFDSGTKIDQLEQWQASIKRGLRGAVLEQYEYFVEASGEMTTMGKEVAALKSMVETQNELIKEMKDIDFTGAFADGDGDKDGDGDEMDSLDSNGGENNNDEPVVDKGDRARLRRQMRSGNDDDDNSSLSSDEEVARVERLREKLKQDMSADGITEDHVNTHIEVPSWLDDVSEEIAAFIKECRYTDATDLFFKAKSEVNDILNQHDRPTENKLTKKQHANMLNMLSTLESLSERMSSRLVEGLRRKNEAYKQSGKRDRSDPLSLMAPMVSPCCLNDDSIPLHLLVKLGKTQEAATAYAARRSLLLLESLHERPISGSGNVDLVIYAAQLSQSFFSCLATAVEGFLDLFLVQDVTTMPRDDGELSALSAASGNVPPGALASIVLWCDSELSKFSSAFGGTRILGNLALSPPPRQELVPSRSRVVGFEEEGYKVNKERQNAIEVASQCVDQAFTFASENLDSIGLPLTPRLAEYIRSRLKGCESEVSKLLNSKWRHITFEWEIELDEADIPMDEGRRFSSQAMSRSQEAAA
mmetsp:Transcript_4471/g.5179  ORF Transcript_4471/g.5179 Transcript_4471/m.5179 type:complete len:813 (-) Transcript_4471:64-2502(-)